MRVQPKYLIYATLLDTYQNYVSGGSIWQDYYGFSEDPAVSEDEFCEKQKHSLLDRINRVPLSWEDSEKADRGTAFNEVIDCLLSGKKSEKTTITLIRDGNTAKVRADYNGRSFVFPLSLCQEFSRYFHGASSQVQVAATLPTQYGDVLLYGYIDELMPTSIHDIKTTGQYKVGKFRRNWQHIVYPYCLNASGNDVRDFEYNVAVLNDKYPCNYETRTEHYNYVPERDVPRLVECVEGLVEFIEAHRDVITDKKIFNNIESILKKYVQEKV
jgi:hypothetical protein